MVLGSSDLLFRASSSEGVGAGISDESVVSSLLFEVLVRAVGGVGFSGDVDWGGKR